MSESKITKKYLAATLKELLRSTPFEKVSVSDICDTCGVSRKTFYYHFQDKFALAEWVFNTEFIAGLKKAPPSDFWEIVRAVCEYFYEERQFYSALLQYGGQNSFREHFQSFLFDTLAQYLLPDMEKTQSIAEDGNLPTDETRTFFVHYVSDSLLIAIYRWISTGAHMPPQEFVALLQSVSKLIQIRENEKTGPNAGADGAVEKADVPAT